MVRVEGLEPPRLAAPEPKSGASANFAIPAKVMVPQERIELPSADYKSAAKPLSY